MSPLYLIHRSNLVDILINHLLAKRVCFGVFVYFFLAMSVAKAQGLCNTLPPDAVVGGFSVNTNSGCSPLTINITDLSGGTGIKYYYNYNGESVADLANIPSTTATSETYLSATSKTYTILQVGKKNGKDMYACQQITVANLVKPVFSASVCNTTLEITIPKQETPIFSSYSVSWPGKLPFTISASELPYNKDFSLSTTSVTLTVEGNLPAASTCTNASVTQTLNGSNTNNPTNANIDEVILTASDKATIKMTGSYKGDYRLFMTENGTDFDFNSPFKTNISPGKLDITLPSNTKSYCFTLERNLVCGGTERSPDVCTVPIISSDVDAKDYTISWINHSPTIFNISPLPPFFGTRSNTSTLSITNGGVSPITLGTGQVTYTATATDCKKPVCFRITTSTNGTYSTKSYQSTSISNELCLDRSAAVPPALSGAFVTVSGANKLEINSGVTNWGLALDKVILYRENSSTPLLETKASIGATTLSDLTANPDEKSYCYQVQYTDECGSKSELTKAFCSTFLATSASNLLTWSTASPFSLPTTIGSRNIFHYQEGSTTTVQAASLPASDTSFIPNLQAFNQEATFYIESSSNDGKISRSNTVKILIKPSIIIPNVFTPNDDNPISGNDGNDVFMVKGNLAPITKFELTIFTLWGKEVIRITDKSKGWDGKIDGVNAPTGTYVYHLKATDIRNEKYERKGTFLLLR